MTKTHAVVPRLLAFGVLLLAVLPASRVHGDTGSFLGVTSTQYCERWRDNALPGAKQCLRGATREVQYVSVSTLS